MNTDERNMMATAIEAVTEGLAQRRLKLPPAKLAELMLAAFDLMQEWASTAGPKPEVLGASALYSMLPDDAGDDEHSEGLEALRRLLPVAEGHSGQCRRVAAFLLGLYNGDRFPFDLTELRGLDAALFADCLAVLRMDYQPFQEVHVWFPDGGRRFEALAETWGIEDVQKLRRAAAGFA